MARLFGSGDEINFGTGISKLSIGVYTIMSWEFMADVAQQDGRITNRAVGNTAGHMQLTELSNVGSTKALRLRQTFTGADALAVSQDNFMLVDEWAFYAGTLNSSNVPRLFRSKPNESTMVEATYGTQTTGVGSAETQESEEFLIGNSSAGTQVFIGRQANVSIYNRVLGQNEMLSVKAGVILTGLLLFVPLWGIASPEPDLSPNPEQGTVVGATKADHAPVGFYAVSA